MSNYKVLHVTGEFSSGGITRFIRDIVELDQLDSLVQHDVVYFIHSSAPQKINNKKVFNYSLYFEQKSLFKHLKVLYKKYDVFFIHKAHPITIAPLLFSKKPIYLFQHGMAVSRGNHIKRNVKQIWYTILPHLLNAKIICSTNFACEKMWDSGINIHINRIIKIPFGTRMKRSSSTNMIRDDRIIIGAAAAFAPIKRLDWLIKSFSGYNGHHLFHVVLAGDGPLRGELEALALQVKSEKVQFEFIGYQSDLQRFYDSIDLFCFPSHNESFGLVVLEALFRNCPLVVFDDLGGALEALDENNSIRLKPGIETLASFWHDLDANPGRVEKLKEKIASADLSRWEMKQTRLKLDSLIQEKR